MVNTGAVSTVTNTTALAALGAASAQYKTVFVSGTNVSYTWNPSSTATADGTYIIAATGVTTGRWYMDQPTTLVSKSWRNIFELIILDSNGPAIVNSIVANSPISSVDSFVSSAISAGGAWYFPPGTYSFASTIVMAPGVEFHGAGMGNTTFELSQGSHPWGMELLNPNGTDQIEGFKLYDIKFLVTGSSNGIRWNSATGGFTDDNTSQDYMMRAIIQRCRILADFTYPNNYTGIELNKCFDSVVQDCELVGWGTGIHFKGTDLSRIEHNRIQLSSNYALNIESANTFGSGTRIVHNDILSPGTSGTSASSALITSDRDGYFCDNYIEGFGVVTDAIQITGGFNHKINDNRIEWDNATNVLRVRSSAITGNALYGVEFVNNHTTDQMGNITWESPGYYFTNSAKRTYIYVARNTAFNNLVPLNSAEDDTAAPPNYAAYYTPGRKGVAIAGISTGLTCVDGYFALPANADTGQYIEFSNNADDGNWPANVIKVNVGIDIVAYSDTANQVLNWEAFDGASSIGSGTTTLTVVNRPTYRPLLTPTHDFTTNCKVRIWNEDTTHGGTIFIRAVGLTNFNP